jgi:hypothetical protein
VTCVSGKAAAINPWTAGKFYPLQRDICKPIYLCRFCVSELHASSNYHHLLRVWNKHLLCNELVATQNLDERDVEPTLQL